MINSILTNSSAMEALQSLDATNQALSNTQRRISSRLRVQTAKNDASACTIATTMQAKVASYNDASQNPTAIQSEVTQLTNQINDIVASPSFNGVNPLNGSTAGGLTFLAATNNGYAGTTAPGATASPTIATAAEIDVSPANATTLNAALQTIDNFNSTVQEQAAQFGAVQQNIEGQQTLVNNLATSLTSGISTMIDANMTAESAQLSALQTQQQLGTQTLAIANQTPQLLLKLFP